MEEPLLDRLWPTWLLALLWIGCAPEIQVVRYEDHFAGAAKPPDCVVRVYAAAEAAPESCEQVADVFVGESGSTTGCGAEEMIDHLRQQTCLAGADAAQIIRVSPPAGDSSCHQVRGRLLRCTLGSAGSQE